MRDAAIVLISALLGGVMGWILAILRWRRPRAEARMIKAWLDRTCLHDSLSGGFTSGIWRCDECGEIVSDHD